MKTENTILLIINPISGDMEKDVLIESVTEKVTQKGFRFCLYKTQGEDDAEAISALIAKERPSRLLVAGGDGTIKMVAEIVEDSALTIGILPAGSANGLATNLGIQGELDDNLEIALGDHIIEIDTVLINDHISLHIADMGLNAALIKNYENSAMRGKLGYLINTVPTLIQEDYPYMFDINANGESISVQGVLLAIANANCFGTGANINPTGKMNDGKFEVLVFKKLDLVEIIKTLQSKLEVDPEFVHTICTDSAVISCEKNIDFQIDGEYIGALKEVKAAMNSKKMRLAVPEKTVQLCQL